MDPGNTPDSDDPWTKSSSSANEWLKALPSSNDYNLHQRIGEGFSFRDQQFSESNRPSENTPRMEQQVIQTSQNRDSDRVQGWDPRAMLKNMSFIEQKIHQLQELVNLIVDHKSLVGIQGNDVSVQQQQLITADLTSIIIQLISTAGSLLPAAMPPAISSPNPTTNQSQHYVGFSGISTSAPSSSVNVTKVEDQPNHVDLTSDCVMEQHDGVDEDEAHEDEHLPPGSYEILQLEKEEILAPHTHFCTICGKGFKRDANLRMHMRGHGDEYKTPAALAKPHKEPGFEPMLIKRYSCPCVGCKRNKEHKKFQPLKTILCVKNHYKRTHCEKSFACSRCHMKKFSVMADLKTHEKHCGKDKWLCSCGTTFSRKDKLFGHISLFQGHTPAIPHDEINKGLAGTSEQGGQTSEATSEPIPNEIGFQNAMDVVKGETDNLDNFFTPLDFESSMLGEFQEFPQPPFEDPENSLFSSSRFM